MADTSSSSTSEPDLAAAQGVGRPRRARLRSDARRHGAEGSETSWTLREPLEAVMPLMLAEAEDEATDLVLAVSKHPASSEQEGGPGVSNARHFAHALTAALGKSLPSLTAAAVENLVSRADLRLELVPKWLRPAIDHTRHPRVMTMTSFANDRSRVVREAIEESIPVLISRRGRILAAIVPLEEGSYETATELLRAAGRRRLEAIRQSEEVELNDDLVEEILSSDDPGAVAQAHGIDVSDWTRDRRTES